MDLVAELIAASFAELADVAPTAHARAPNGMCSSLPIRGRDSKRRSAHGRYADFLHPPESARQMYTRIGVAGARCCIDLADIGDIECGGSDSAIDDVIVVPAALVWSVPTPPPTGTLPYRRISSQVGTDTWTTFETGV